MCQRPALIRPVMVLDVLTSSLVHLFWTYLHKFPGTTPTQSSLNRHDNLLCSQKHPPSSIQSVTKRGSLSKFLQKWASLAPAPPMSPDCCQTWRATGSIQHEVIQLD
jgi:hypothetical protein